MYRIFSIIIFVCIALLAPHNTLLAQKNVFLHPDRFYKKFFPHLKIKKNPPDSNYIRIYPKYLSIGMHVLSPAISLNIKPRGNEVPGSDPTLKFRTNIADIVGFAASYRFVSAGFAFLLKSGINKRNDYAPSRYRTATIKYNSSAYVLQFKYLRFKGFTDLNQAQGFDPNSRYIKRPDMVSKEYQFEGVYNFSWKKYSYIAALNFSQRQIKSRAGMLFKAGVYYNQISGDSALVNRHQKQYYNDFINVSAIRTLSIKIAPGFGGNLVLKKHIYFAIAVFPSIDIYFYKYLNTPAEKVKSKQSLVFVLDGKASLGYQSKRLYAGFRYETESRNALLSNVQINTVYKYLGVEFGYRFDAPRVVKKFYKKTMPPGM